MTQHLSGHKFLLHKEMLLLGNLWKVKFAYDLHMYSGAANGRGFICLILHIMAVRQLCDWLLGQNVQTVDLSFI